jgi:hypothetical protein
MKILIVGVSLVHTEGRTDMTKLIASFRSFCESA